MLLHNKIEYTSISTADSRIEVLRPLLRHFNWSLGIFGIVPICLVTSIFCVIKPIRRVYYSLNMIARWLFNVDSNLAGYAVGTATNGIHLQISCTPSGRKIT